MSLVLDLKESYGELGMFDCTVLFPFYDLKFFKKDAFFSMCVSRTSE